MVRNLYPLPTILLFPVVTLTCDKPVYDMVSALRMLGTRKTAVDGVYDAVVNSSFAAPYRKATLLCESSGKAVIAYAANSIEGKIALRWASIV